MNPAVAEEPRVLHALPGRVRVHLPQWSGAGQRDLEARFRRIRGVRKVQANRLTQNALIQFDPQLTDEQTVLAALAAMPPLPAETPEEAAPPSVLVEKQGGLRRARIAVRGLDRTPTLTRRVVERLRRLNGVVRAVASPLTSRVLVEFDERQVELESLIAEVTELELPPLPDEDQPRHPLDPAPLFQSATRAIGVALGLGIVEESWLQKAERDASK